MNRELTLESLRALFDQTTLDILYERNKVYLLPFLGIILSCVLVIYVILPQIQNYFQLQDQAKNLDAKIFVMEKNILFLSTLDDKNLNNNLQTVSYALPPEKDFTAVMQAISQASSVAGVAIGDFSFQPGIISNSSAQAANAKSSVISEPSLDISVNITGGVDQTKRFIQEISKRLPLSQVEQVSVSNNASVIVISFYYEEFPQLKNNENVELRPLTQKETEIIQKLSGMQSTSSLLEQNDILSPSL